MPIRPLTAAQVRLICDQTLFTFETTAELPSSDSVIGQPRGLRSLAFGLSVQAEGYNIFMLGPAGAGRTTALEKLVSEEARRQPVPLDWVYIHNFDMPERPLALALPPGQGRELRQQMDSLVQLLQYEIKLHRGSDGETAVSSAISDRLRHLCQTYQEVPNLAAHLHYVTEEIAATPLALLHPNRYAVRLMANNGQTNGAPLVFERYPTRHSLFGRLEYVWRQGDLTPYLTTIQPGSLHAANGGYLILQASDLLEHFESCWLPLRQALQAGEIPLVTEATAGGGIPVHGLDPEPIPLTLKLILLGSADEYYTFYELDELFARLFKVRAEFDWEMPLDEVHVAQYAAYIATVCHKEGLCHLDKAAVAKVVEYGARLVEHQKRLSARMGLIADLLREASYWATVRGDGVVTTADIQQALTENAYRSSLVEQRIREEILEEVVFVATTGSVVGQVNGLSIIDTGDYMFGQPGRITARTYMGEDGIVHIERETDMSGPIHHKGVLTLMGYFGGQYAQKQPLSFSASLTFEQNYFGVEGDSASSSELYALLSSLSNLPVKQGIGVTGSVNQRGEIQPISGVNEKIEGFYHICAARGLTGKQGVIIPVSNVENLMLHEDVVTAVAAQQFHIWPVRTIDEGIEILTGMAAGTADDDGNFPQGTVHDTVQQRLLQLARDLKSFGDGSDSDEDEDEE
ncbi:MAG: Lon protease family protein [Chloroflexota bacterium]